MSVFRILAEEIENWYANQPTVSLINEGDKKYYYHGRNTGARPYYGKYIFITDSFGYASGYGDGKIVHVYTLPFGDDRLFSIKNPHHLSHLRKYIDDYTISVIFKSSNNDEEIDWAALSYIGTDEFEQPEDLFEHMGYYGIKLKERTGINSIYVFDEKYLTYEGTIDLTTPEMQNKIRQFYHNFEKDKHFIEEENEVTGSTKTPQEIANSLVTDPRFKKVTVLVNLDVQLADEAFKRDTGFYIGKEDKGIGIRKEKVMELIKSGELKYAPEASIYLTNDGKPRLSFGDGRHRFAVLRDLGVKSINMSIWNAPQSRKLIPLLQRNDQNNEKQNQWESYTAEEIAKHIYNLLTPEQQEENDWNFNDYYNTIKGFGEAYELIDINPNDLKFNEDFYFDTVENYEYLMKQNSPIPEIVIDADNGIIDGNHRAKAAMNLGKTIKAYRAIQQYANESNDIPKINETTYKVYHGTNEKFGNFNFNKATQGIIWFTDSIDSIQKGEHGGQGNKYIMTRYITINNPAGWKEYEKYGLQQLQDMGYDGVILPQGNKTDYFVFSNKNISAKPLTEEEDYRGQHTAPTSEDSPMYDVTNAFGEDIYTDKALRMFGLYGSYDSYSIALIQRARNKPNMLVKIYRAIPKVITNQDRFNDYEKQKLYILKTGRLPKGADNWRNSSEYYDWLSNEVDRLRGLPQETEEKVKINNGDWVTINPAYAKVHGQSNLNNKFKVLSKTVPAKNLFTDGNSIHEWGYVGNDLNERKKKRQIGMALPLGQIFTGGMLEEQTEPIERGTSGDCYKNVQDYLLDNDIPYATIVHGVVTSRNGTLNHAWIETDEDVYDPTTGVKTDKEKYYAKLNPQVHARYTFTDALKQRFITGNYGPWTESTNEGVADKYAEKAFNIPDTGEEDYYKATAALPPDPSMGEYVCDVYDDEDHPLVEKRKLLSRIFKNPKNLTKFGKNVRAVSDINGNFYIAETDAPFFHQELQDALWNKGIHDSFMQWYRMGLSNLFTLSGSYMGLSSNTEETYLKNVKTKNPQFRFLTRQNTEVANEGVADDARERMFNIPNPEAEMDYKATRNIEPTSDMGEYVGDIIIGDEFQSRVFKNPKNLDKFGNRHGGSVKAISLPNGDIYIAEKDAFFFHNDILRSLNLPRSPYIAWYASNYNDGFSMAMSSFDKKSMDRITKMRDVVQYRFPQYKFNID
jgi:hypothetical protein